MVTVIHVPYSTYSNISYKTIDPFTNQHHHSQHHHTVTLGFAIYMTNSYSRTSYTVHHTLLWIFWSCEMALLSFWEITILILVLVLIFCITIKTTSICPAALSKWISFWFFFLFHLFFFIFFFFCECVICVRQKHHHLMKVVKIPSTEYGLWIKNGNFVKT